METFKIEFTVTILIYLTPIIISEDFEVFRPKPPGEDGWILGRDSFKIPPSLCNQGGMNCAHFNARKMSACHCLCPYVDATFMFDRNDWRCLNNFQTRQLLGYNPTDYFLFESERLNYPIRPVFFNNYKRVSLLPSLKNCRVDVGSSRYIGCKGSEVSFNNTDLFSIIPDGDPRDSPPYFLKVASAASNTKLLEGRIIKLGVVCNGPVNRWLLFKYVGSIKCLAPTLPPKVTTKPGERNLKLFPSQGTGMAGNTAPTFTGREQGTDDSSSSHGLIAGLTATILAVSVIIIGFFAYRRGYLTYFVHSKLRKPRLPPKKRVKRKSTTSVNTQSTSGSRDGEDKYRTPDIKQASIYYASNYVVPPPDNPSLEYASSSLPVGLNTHCHDNRAGTQQSVYKAVYKDPDCDSDLRSTKKGPVCADQPVYNQMEELSVRGPPLGSVQDHDHGTKQPGAHLRAPMRHQTCGHDKTLESAGYRDPDFASELRSKLKGPIRAEQPVYTHVEELCVRGATVPAKSRDYSTQQPVSTAVYKDPDFDSKLRPKKKSPVCLQQPVYNHVEELSVRGAKGPAKGPDNDNQQPVYTAVYKDPDLDGDLRSKKEGLVCVQQPAFNHVEELAVRESKGPAKGLDNGNQQPLCTAVYKDPDLDKELRLKKRAPVCVQQPVYNQVEELPVREAKGPAKGPTKGSDNANQKSLCTAVYKDPDLDKELRPKKRGPVCVQQPVYNHVEELSVPGAKGLAKGRENDTQPECNVLESYLECSKRPSQYVTMMSSKELVFNTIEKSKPNDTKKLNDS